MVKLGRNELCHCGSGKKYKQCHLKADQQAEREAKDATTPTADLSALRLEAVKANIQTDISPELDAGLEDMDAELDELFDDEDESKLSHEEMFEARKAALSTRFDIDDIAYEDYLEQQGALIDAFDEADYQDKIALYQQTLATPLFMDEETAFEMLNQLYELALEHGERDNAGLWLDQLEEALPDIYQAEERFFVGQRISNLLTRGDHAGLVKHREALIRLATSDIDLFNRIADQLRFHGQTVLLLEVMQAAWDDVQKSQNIVPWGVVEFGLSIATLMGYHHLDERQQDVTNDIQDLMKAVEPYAGEVITEEFTRMVQRLAGEHISDFRPEQFSAVKKVRQEALTNLCFEFMGFARQQGIAYSLAGLAFDEYHRYFSEQKATKSVLRFHHKRLDRHLGELMFILNPQHYKVVAMFALIPQWLEFLGEKGLLESKEILKQLKELQVLRTALLEEFKLDGEDPALHKALEAFPTV